MRFCENFYFNLRYCGFIRLSSFLSFQNVVLVLSNCDQKMGVTNSFSGQLSLKTGILTNFHPKNRRIKQSK